MQILDNCTVNSVIHRAYLQRIGVEAETECPNAKGQAQHIPNPEYAKGYALAMIAYFSFLIVGKLLT